MQKHGNRFRGLGFALVLFAIVLGGFAMMRFSASTDQPETRPPPANTFTQVVAAVNTANGVSVQPMVGGGYSVLRWPGEADSLTTAIIIDIAPMLAIFKFRSSLPFSSLVAGTARDHMRQVAESDNASNINADMSGRFAGDAPMVAFIHRPLLASSGRFAAGV